MKVLLTLYVYLSLSLSLSLSLISLVWGCLYGLQRKRKEDRKSSDFDDESFGSYFEFSLPFFLHVINVE
jgi:hypothetical protein